MLVEAPAVPMGGYGRCSSRHRSLPASLGWPDTTGTRNDQENDNAKDKSDGSTSTHRMEHPFGYIYIRLAFQDSLSNHDSRHLAVLIPTWGRDWQNRAGIDIVSSEETATTAAATTTFATLMSLASSRTVKARRADATTGDAAVDPWCSSISLPSLLVKGLGLVPGHHVGIGTEQVRLAVFGIDLVLLRECLVGRVEIVLQSSDSTLGRLAHPFGHFGKVLQNGQEPFLADLVQHALRLGSSRSSSSGA